MNYVQAFASLVEGKTIVVGNDSRVSHQLIKNIAISCLQMMGKNVIDIGLVSTPTVQMMVQELNASAGLIITASHNPIEWNGLKFVQSDALFFSPEKFQALLKAFELKHFKFVDWKNIGTYTQVNTANSLHIKRIIELDYNNIEKIKQRKFKIVVDPINGAGSEIMQELLKGLNCEVIVINGESNGLFAHKPEPLEENLSELMKIVKESQADLGIAVDPDCDRCVLIDNYGKAIGEEYTLALAVKHILSKKLGPVVKNMSSTQAINDIAKYYNCPCYEASVGEINVALKMQEVHAVIGGEGNGGVMLPDLHIGRDAPLAATIILSFLAENNLTLSAARETLPSYFINKDKITVESLDFQRIKNHFKSIYKDLKHNETDGLKIYHHDWWIHLRKSNTEPIIRIICESKTEEETKNLTAKIKLEIENLSRS
jgi:phosphomannomutase